MTIQSICISTYIRRNIRILIFLIVVLSVSFSPYLFSADFSKQIDSRQVSTNRERISDEELDTLRGGFALPSGLIVDFSFYKRIYKNGIEEFYTYFELPKNIELSRTVTPELTSNFTNMILNSVIKNNLDNQTIKTINTVNIDISNIKNINLDANSSAFFRNLVGPTYK